MHIKERQHHHHGFAHDLTVLAEFAARRRALLKWGLGLGALPILGCVGTSVRTAETADAGGAAGAAGVTGDTATEPRIESCTQTPQETGGPYPGDGTNGKNALVLSGIVRSDIRSSIAGASGVAEGIALTVSLTVVDKNGCSPLAGHAVYIWHCDRDGNYSMYSAAAAGENYLRGVQETDDNGQVTFTTIFPACYSGRWPHIHFEVYPSLDAASAGKNASLTSQLALPKATCDLVYASDGYSNSVRNLAATSLQTDNVFSDGADLETPTLTGSVSSGYAAELLVTV